MFGLKIVRVWAALTGLAAGFAAGAAAGSMLGLEETGILIAGGALESYWQWSVRRSTGQEYFFLCFFSSRFQYGACESSDWNSAAVCLAVSLVAALLALRFVTVLTIIVTSLFGGLTAGAAVYYLLPVDQGVLLPVLCVIFCALGIVVQLLLESEGRREKV